MAVVPTTRIPFVALGALALLASGCGSSSRLPAPTETEMAATRTALTQAEQAGAGEYAPVELRAARQKLEQAEAAVLAEDTDAARLLVEQALVDAELAQVKALAAQSQAAEAQLEESTRVLREEIERGRRGDG